MIDSMHRINTKKRRTIILRCLAYGVTVLLSVFTTALLVYIALGYQFDPRSGQVTRSGLLLVNAQPSGTSIHLDGQRRTDVPGRFVLQTGQYNMLLQKDGYRDWSKDVTIAGSAVESVRYPLLIPENLSSTALRTVNQSPDMVSQSPDQKNLLAQTRSGQPLTVVELDASASTQRVLDLDDTMTLPLGSLRVLDWTDDSSRALVEHRSGNGAREVLSVHTRNADESVNITQRYRRSAPTQLQYRTNGEVYGISSSGTLTRYSLQETQSTPVLEDVSQYASSDANRLVFVRTADNKTTLEAGVVDQRSSDAPVILSTVERSAADGLAIGSLEFDNNWYAVISDPSAQRADVYRNPLDTPILARQLPFTTISFTARQLLASPNGQFLLLQNGQRSFVYDFDSLRSYSFTTPQKIRSNRGIGWATAHHLVVVDDKQQSYVVDFDGTNQQQLQDVTQTTSVYFDEKRESLYFFATNGLRHTSLLIEE